MKPIAIIIPWFGADLPGGAEQQAFQIATRLVARKHAVSILTTCSRSFYDDWTVNHYQPGESHEHGLTIHRFPVDERDASAFDLVNAKLLTVDRSALRPGVNPVTTYEAHTFIHENIKSAALLEYLEAEHHAYHAFLFLPYMFGPSVLGVPTVSDRAWLQPCLHDEAAAYLPQMAEMFSSARALLFNSPGELELALRLFGPGIYNRSQVVGEGIERPQTETTRLPAQLQGTRFVLYLGRRDRTKNTDLLARAFAQFKAAHPTSDLMLVLAGPGSESFASTEGLIDLGLVSDETKRALLAYCRALTQPSLHESFSRTMMEAWSLGRPVVVHGDCLATAGAVRDSAGGWLASTESEWAQLFVRIADASDEELAGLGALGRAYAEECADWDKVITRYEMLLGLAPDGQQQEASAGWASAGWQSAGWQPAVPRAAVPRAAVPRAAVPRAAVPRAAEPGAAVPRAAVLRAASPQRSAARPHDDPPDPHSVLATNEPLAIHQLLPDIVYGDAISNQALAIRQHLRQQGYQSEIFVKRREARMSMEALLWDESQPSSPDGLIYHHSIGSELTAFAVAHQGPKCLVYHNITPALFFTQYRPGFAWMLETGRAHLPQLAPHFPISVGDSAYNAAELTACGFREPGVLSIIVDPDKWNIAPNAEVMTRLQDGRTNLLFVGRVAPNKQQEQLIQAFEHYRRLDPDSRLIIVGEGSGSDPYFSHLVEMTAALDLSPHVEITGQVEDATLLACYRTAHLYWSASAHEGFGAPLIEAMWFDVPVLALNAAAVPETLGAAGVLFDRGEEPDAVAARAYRLTQDKDLRATVIAAQRKRRLDFTSAAVSSSLVELVERLTTSPELCAGAPS